MTWTKSQVQLRYHQTLNRICEMELLAEKLQRLADSYRVEERSRIRAVREDKMEYESDDMGQPDTGAALYTHAEELRAVAAAWYARAKEEYYRDMQRVGYADT